jgi:hypothetical protein
MDYNQLNSYQTKDTYLTIKRDICHPLIQSAAKLISIKPVNQMPSKVRLTACSLSDYKDRQAIL